jgi:hypothetical protein
MRIALIHALRHSPPPIEAAFARAWPGVRLMNLLDDSLSADLARDGRLTPAMTERFLTLSRYAVGTGADGILFTCSAFGPCIEAVAAERAPMPVLKPNEAMIEEAVAAARAAAGQARRPRIGLLATFQPTLESMPAEFPADVEIVPMLAPGALAALDAGDLAAHDRLAAGAARWRWRSSAWPARRPPWRPPRASPCSPRPTAPCASCGACWRRSRPRGAARPDPRRARLRVTFAGRAA